MIKLTRRNALSLIGSALAMPYIGRAYANETLNLYSWADYFPQAVLDAFEKETSIHVVYDAFASSEEMEAKMLAGSTGYDVVLTSGGSLPTFIKTNVFDKIDKTKVPNFGNLDPEILRLVSTWDPNNEHAIIYTWGSVGFTYNVDMVKERIPDADFSSMDLIFKPENASKLSDCGISILDSPGDIMLMVLKYLGKDGDSNIPEDFEAVVEAFKPIRQYIRTFDNENFTSRLANKELCVANNWAGNYASALSAAKEAGITDLNLAYFVPKTGAPAWADCIAIPSDSKRKDNAHKFLEFLLRPEVSAECANYNNYASGNLASTPFVNKELIDDPAIYPSEEVKKLLWAPKAFSLEQLENYTRAWEEIKSG